MVGMKTCVVIAAIMGASYLGGRMTNTGVAEYEYSEVYNVVGECEAGYFTGTCSDCKQCLAYEYNAGGCSYFKDTLCTLCEDISHCGTTENAGGKEIPAITCTDGFDSVCSECEPGYFDKDCKPCLVCEEGEYEVEKCTQTSNTVCAACTECNSCDSTEPEYVATACTYFSNTVCGSCTVCNVGTFSDQTCQCEDPNVYVVTADTVCEACSEPEHLVTFVEELCTITKDTKLQDCGGCRDNVELSDGEYITELCMPGHPVLQIGEPQKCDDCAQCPKDANGVAKKWTNYECKNDDHEDTLWHKCSEVLPGEYLFEDCTCTSDTKTITCTKIEHCEEGRTVCTTADDQQCEDCMEGYYGPQCQYEKQMSACGTITTRERRVDQMGYEGTTNEEFVEFCLELCEEFPDCMAFEVIDGGDWLDVSGDFDLYSDPRTQMEEYGNLLQRAGSGGAGGQVREKSCHMKSAYTHLTLEYGFDCYSNIKRQGHKFRDVHSYNKYCGDYIHGDPCLDFDKETCKERQANPQAYDVDCFWDQQFRECTTCDKDEKREHWMLWYQADYLNYRHGWGEVPADAWDPNTNHPSDPPTPPQCEKTPHCELGVIVDMDKHGCGGHCVNVPGLEVTPDGWTQVEEKYYTDADGSVVMCGVDSLFNMWVNHMFVGVWNEVRDSAIVYDLHTFNGQDYRVDNLGHAFSSAGDAVGT